MINGKQNVKLDSGFIKFTNYSRQIPVSFKIYADSECFFKKVVGISNNDVSYTKKYQDHAPCSLLIKLCVLIIDIVKKLFCIEERILLSDLLNQFLMSTIIVEE